MLNLNVENRNPDAKAYLEEKYAEYCEFMKKSNTIEKKILDQLSTMPYLKKSSKLYINDKYINLSNPISSNKLLTNISYSKENTNLSTNEKSVRFLDNEIDEIDEIHEIDEIDDIP